jgi:nicotinamidase-related amidase
MARDARTPVILVQHAGEAGHPLAEDGPGFAFHSRLTPDGAETVIVKRHCNAFQDTDIAERLRDSGIGRLVVCGMQSQYCVDTFVRAAVERGLKVQLVSDGHTTFGTDILSADRIIAHHNNLLDGSFAELVRAEEVVFQ